jgi:alanyl-tRNA synthetase
METASNPADRWERNGEDHVMTRRLYYTDSYRREVTSAVTDVRARDDRGPAVALEETVFYAAAGGQPADHGVLAGYPVVDVLDDGGEIWHVLDPAAALPSRGARVTGVIDWPRRFDHMQQHTGQHILSQAFLRELDAQTLSVHMDRTCTMDLALTALDAPGAERVERLANTVVFENRPLSIREVDAGEATRLGLRRPPKQAGLIRVVEVDDFDRSACGGTHVRTTGEVGPVVVRSWQRYKGGTRVEFLCGGRALAGYRHARGILRDAGARLTTGEAEIAAAVTRLQERVRELERDLETARSVLLDREAGELIADARAPQDASSPGTVAVVARVLGGRSIDEARVLARAIAQRPDCVAILVMEGDRRMIVARGAGVALDAAAVLREALAVFGGRGGGRPEAAEGAAGSAPSAEALLGAARAAARRALAGDDP